MKPRSLAKRIESRVDLWVSAASIAVLLTFIPILLLKHFNPIYLVAVGVGLIAVSLYLLWRKSLNANNEHSQVRTQSFWFNGLPYALYAIGVLSFIFRSNQYQKPLGYYAFIAVAVAIALWGVARRRVSTPLMILLAVAIGLTHIWTENMMFPSILGLDPWVHFNTTTRILGEAGEKGVPPVTIQQLGGGYSLMHVYLRWIIGVTGLSYKAASLIFWASFQVVGIIVLSYLIGRELFSKEVGIVAALMIANANWVVFFGEWIIPNAMGATMSLVVLYLVIKSWKTQKVWIAAISLLMIPIAFLTHFIAAIWVAGTAACISILNLWRKWIYIPVGLVGIAALLIWYNYAAVGGAVANIAENLAPSTGLTFPVGSAPSLLTTLPNYLYGLSWELTLDSMGMFLFFGIAIMGLLLMAKRGAANRVVGLLGIVVLLVGIVPPLLGISLIEHRWWYFAEVLMAVPIGVAAISLFRLKKGMLAVPCLGLVVFLSLVGLPSNTTNRDLSPHLIVRYSLTSAELEAFDIAESYHPKQLGSDPLFVMMIEFGEAKPFVFIDENILAADFTTCPADVIVLRDALYREPFGYGAGAVYQLTENPVGAAVRGGYIEVWDNAEAHVLVRK